MAAAIGFSACTDDLDVTPIDPNTNTTVDADALFNKCYATMALAGNTGPNGDCDIDGLDGGTTGFVRQIVNAGSLTTDEAHCCWGDDGIPQYNYNTWNSSHPMLKGLYYRLYFGVTLYNHYLDVCSDVDATRTAEVRFLRALHYFYLMDCFGNAPFITQVGATATQIGREELYNFIESELLDCVNDLSAAAPKSSSDSNYGRADKAAAWLLLSRLYLNSEVYTGTARYSEAKEYAQKVLDAGYGLNTTGSGDWTAYQMLFMGDNGETTASTEAVLPLLQDGATCASWGTSLYLIASCFASDMVIYNNVSNNTSEFWNGLRARPNLVAKFFNDDATAAPTDADIWGMQEASNDDRCLFWSKGRSLNIEETGTFESGYSVAKFHNQKTDGSAGHDSQFPDADWFLMRAAEAYLNIAEADARLNGGYCSSEGLDAINALRERANTTTYTTCSLSQICDEWAREFYFEGYRRTVLIRFDKFGGSTDYKWQWKGGDYDGIDFDSHLNIFAIPSTDMNANATLVQNPGY